MPPIVKTDEERVMEFFATAHPIKVGESTIS
jgi:predicted nucleic acid-binding OB-fold protein